MRDSAVTRSTLRQQIADALRDEVLAGRLKPGQEFTVKEIAEQYGVSATPVREALVDLSAQGLLDAVQHRGFCVHEFSLADYRSLVEARGLMAAAMFRDIDAVRLRRESVSPPKDESGVSGVSLHGRDAITATFIAVRRRGEEARRAAVAGDLIVLIGYDIRFWRELATLFGNPYLSDFSNRLLVQSWACAVGHLRRVDNLRGMLWSGHTDLIDAFLRRDRSAAFSIVADYHEHSLALIERLAAE
ncbi:GntR family transcriptional regulator [Streptomyces jeddahensis]|uniref:HTH-type transcriptional regulator McbR n=1 Tax=Streptomyces jeddahensis TaxID=1716141 RepID=A0A177I1N0_9ACTN|nr:GntR family transcriptional regulator [Streptomyces jeddahensis]OAH16454.1 HTH-type transcriptional regulator McbR [Streptomyces jeddahensis]